ncbi:MAG: phosphatidate cytidylyltransferase [Clostridiales bacterium]|jgi:phosphatidate cytidylyltransferase|nr:phosphatidate cytidylyltransferase [Clostridiales bacterium]
MKTRVISSIVALILLAAMLALNEYVLGLGVFLVGVLGLYEFYDVMGAGGYKPVKWLGMLYSLSLLLILWRRTQSDILGWSLKGNVINLYSAFRLLIIIAVLTVIVFRHEKYSVVDGALTVFGGYYVIFLLSYIILLRNEDNGRCFVILAIIGAFATDIAAFFSGKAFGKRKLIPAISPKKTVAGSVGGFIGAALAVFIYGLILKYTGLYTGIPLYHYLIVGFILGGVSQVGDLSASAIKRSMNVKDFGKIMPGHGGVLDRIDSLIFAAPVVYYYLHIFILRSS